MKKLIKRTFAIVLTLAVMVTVFGQTQVYAEETINTEESVISKNSVMVVDGDNLGIISYTETATDIYTEITSFGDESEAGYFHLDKINGTIYSSYTGETVTLDELLSLDTSDESYIEPRNVVGTVTKKISYAHLASLVSKTSTAISIAGAIISILGIAGLTVATAAGTVASLMGGVVSFIQKEIGNGSTSHGIAVKMNKNQQTKHQAGGTFTYYTYTVIGISTY